MEMDNTLDSVLNPINESIAKSQSYSPDNLNEPLESTTHVEDGKVVEKIDFGNGVIKEDVKSQPTFLSETSRVMMSVLPDIANEFKGVYMDLGGKTYYDLTEDTYGDDATLKQLQFQHPFFSVQMQQLSNLNRMSKTDSIKENPNNSFSPQTETGKAVRDIASELSIMAVNNLWLKKIKLLSGIPKYKQKFKTYFKNLAQSSLRWGFAEGGAAFVARNDTEPFVLMITDLLGITDDNDLNTIRQTYHQALTANEDESKLKLRLIRATDGFLSGAAFEILFSILGTTYKFHRNLLAPLGFSTGQAASVGVAYGTMQSEDQKTIVNENNKKLIQEQFFGFD